MLPTIQQTLHWAPLGAVYGPAHQKQGREWWTTSARTTRARSLLSWMKRQTATALWQTLPAWRAGRWMPMRLPAKGLVPTPLDTKGQNAHS